MAPVVVPDILVGADHPACRSREEACPQLVRAVRRLYAKNFVKIKL